MNIYPHYLLRPTLLGEATVYDLLSAVREKDGFAVHSVNLPEHEYKRWGEADYVVVGRSGLILLEVKGGTVSLAGREWRYENGRGSAITSTEGPARQAISAAVALEKLIGSRLARKVRCRWGVTFPLCRFNREVAELPPSRLADSRVCCDPDLFEQWLREIPFDHRSEEDFALSLEEIHAIREILLPEFSAAASLGLCVSAAEKQVVKLTSQQFSILESLQGNPRLTISGGAGTGKTELAALCARAEKMAGRRPVIVTPESRMSVALAARLKEFGIPVASSRLPAGSDTLIVDEGQDFANTAAMTELFRQLPGGLDAGRWRWFMDPNLQYVGVAPDPLCLSTLSRHSATVTLTRNVRSTREIVETIRTLLNADVGISEIDGYGLKVAFHDASAADEAEIGARLIMDILEDGVHPRDIAVLGAGDGDGPVCRGLATKLSSVLRKASPSASWSAYGVISGISAFRGLEARIVLLVDLDRLCTEERSDAELYIGMSRASAALHLLVTEPVKSFLRQLTRASLVGEEK